MRIAPKNIQYKQPVSVGTHSVPVGCRSSDSLCARTIEVGLQQPNAINRHVSILIAQGGRFKPWAIIFTKIARSSARRGPESIGPAVTKCSDLPYTIVMMSNRFDDRCENLDNRPPPLPVTGLIVTTVQGFPNL